MVLRNRPTLIIGTERLACLNQGLRASSLQFTSPLEFNAIQAVKDSARLLLSPTIGNRLLSVINRLGSSTCHRYIICDSNQYRTAQHRGRAQHHGHLAKSGGTPSAVL